LQQGDVILSYNRTPVEDYRHVQRLVAESAVGNKIVLEVFRKKQKIQVGLTVGEVPDTAPRRVSEPPRRG
jgi:S1-C subfamily serine protease